MIIANTAPHIDWHALAPEIVLALVAILVLLIDLFLKKSSSWMTSKVAAIGLLAAFLPVLTLALDGTDRSLFSGAFVVDNLALVFKGFFIIGAYLVVLLAGDYIREGDYFQSEFWFLMLTSVLGMSALASSRDLITLFVALETVTIPTFVLAGWRKRDVKSNEAAIKYFLYGVLSSAIMLYGMSFVVGLSGSTKFDAISAYYSQETLPGLAYVSVLFVVIGFAFKISAVPFHMWTPDVYHGAPTPVTALLSVLSKGAGFVGLIVLLSTAFFGAYDVFKPLIVLLVVASLIVGNFAALKQTNIVRLLAYSAVAQSGFVLLPLALIGSNPLVMRSSVEAVIIYLLIYLTANLGAFSVVIAAARRLGSGEIKSYNGLGRRDPFLAIAMTLFLFSLAGIPPLAGWFAKFVMFRSALDASNITGTVLAVLAVIASVVAFVYYANVVKRMWLEEPLPLEEFKEEVSDGGGLVVKSQTMLGTPPALKLVISICAAATILLGVFPHLVATLARVGDYFG